MAGMYVARVGSRIIVRTLQPVAAVSPRFKSSYTTPVFESTISLSGAAGAQPLSVEGFQGGEHQFATHRARDIVDRAQNEASETEEGDQCADHGEEELAEAFNHSNHVSLHMVMQSSVPDPYQNGGRPSHQNMPNGGEMQRQKYLSGLRQGTHPSRNFSTGQPLPSKAIPQVNITHTGPSPQGVQGEDCATFQLWLSNCQSYNFSNCEHQLHDLRSGRRTLQQIFEEQDQLIRQIAEDYQKSNNELPKANDSIQGLQGPIPFASESIEQRIKFDQPCPQGVQGPIPFASESIEHRSKFDQPCPQGVQGYECDNFQLWLKNCVQYGFGDCDEQLKQVQTGRKTLSEIFMEQDQMIKQISAQYRSSAKVITGVRYYSTSSNSKDEKEAQSQSAVKLSQRDKLKRAVKEYGTTVVVFHVGMSLTMLGGFYAAVSSGLDVVGLLRSMNIGESILQSKIATGASTFVVAYASYKVFAPLRIAITLSVTPFLVRYLRRIGFLKPPKSSS